MRFIFFITDTLCVAPLLIQGTTPAACTCSCNGSSDGLLGAWTIFTEPNRWIILFFFFNLVLIQKRGWSFQIHTTCF